MESKANQIHTYREEREIEGGNRELEGEKRVRKIMN